jgi:hypothetical protein
VIFGSRRYRVVAGDQGPNLYNADGDSDQLDDRPVSPVAVGDHSIYSEHNT